MTETRSITITVSGDAGMAEQYRGWAISQNIPCPACLNGLLVWAENGYVPGYRICSYCGRGWSAEPTEDGVKLSIPEISRGGEVMPEWEWIDDPLERLGDEPYDSARAHTWGVHGGNCVLHEKGGCPGNKE